MTGKGIYMKTILTIGRQYGSGGREIGQKIADHYGIRYYDKELVAQVARRAVSARKSFSVRMSDPPIPFYTIWLWILILSARALQLLLQTCL